MCPEGSRDLKKHIEEGECFLGSQATFLERLDGPVHVEGVCVAQIENMLSVLAELEAYFVPEDQRGHVLYDNRPLSKLELVEHFLEVVSAVQVLMVSRQLEEFENEFESVIEDILLQQEERHDFQE